MDTGQFYSATVATPVGQTAKGIAVKLGPNNEATILYDTELVRTTAGWVGGFLKFNPARYGIIGPPVNTAPLRFSTPQTPGWTDRGSFDDPRSHKPWGPLPKDVARYKGLFIHDDRTVLQYTVGTTRVLETPWAEVSDGLLAITRTMTIAPGDRELRLIVAATNRDVAVKVDPDIESNDGQRPKVATGDGPTTIVVPPRKEAVSIKVLIGTGRADDRARFEKLVAVSRPPIDVRMLTKPGPERWVPAMTTQGRTSRDQAQPYVVDTITLPLDNPWNALLFCSGVDFFSNGDAAVCTLHGDVWRVSGLDDELRQVRWKRFATGLFQPLGVRVIDDIVHVGCRDQLTRLHDRDGNGEADFYEALNNEGHVTYNGHEYLCCLETDSAGNFYQVKGNGPETSAHQGTVLRTSPDGLKLDVFATGFRNANGLGIGPGDVMTVSPQEGEWTPASAIFEVRPGGFYGMMTSHHREEKPSTFDPPLCWLPRRTDNSCGGQVWVPDDRWGPLTGKMLHFSFGQSTMFLVLRESLLTDADQADPAALPTGAAVSQGGVVQFPFRFESGVCRGRFRPQDGQLYVTGLKGWVSNAVQDGCLQRVRYTGAAVRMPVGLRVYRNGVAIEFACELDRSTVENPGSYHIEQWNYKWRADYGSPEYKVSDPLREGRDEVDVVSATLLDDRTVFLEIDDLKPVMQMGINFVLTSRDGQTVRDTIYNTINRVPANSIDENRLTRGVNHGRLAQDVEQRLRPGLQLRVYGRGVGGETEDTRIVRLAALDVRKDDIPASGFDVYDHNLRAAGFEAVLFGYLKLPLRGEYRFRLVGNGDAMLTINGSKRISLQSARRTASDAATVELQKGYNRVSISYVSLPHPDVEASIRLLWQGEGFPEESVPPTAWFHDSGDQRLVRSQQLRRGRDLFQKHRCARCHAVGKPDPIPGLSEALNGGAIWFEDVSLADIGKRVNTSWIAAWLREPRRLRNHVTMPSIFAGRSDSDRDQLAGNIAAFLVSQSTRPESPAEAAGAAAQGEQLFEQLGCVACHRFSAPHESDDFDRTSLHFVAAKFRPGALAEFLKAPARHHSWTRMPDFQLRDDEAAALESWLRRESKGQIDVDVSSADPRQGKQAFHHLRCNACHSLDPMSEAALPEPISLDPGTPNSGCLGATPNSDVATPWFDLTQDDRDALRVFVDIAGRSDAVLPLAERPRDEASRLLFDYLRCAACHARDGRPSLLPEILAEEGSGRTAEPIPDLTWTGEKLHTAWMTNFLSGRETAKPRPWLKARMPSFGNYARQLAEGLSAEHATAPEPSSDTADRQLAQLGRRLTLKDGGLDCRQCHGVGDRQPTGDDKTKIAPGINFATVASRLREDFYHRMMLDPFRYDPRSKMPKFSADGRTTNATAILDGDARRQFNAIWHFLQDNPQ